MRVPVRRAPLLVLSVLLIALSRPSAARADSFWPHPPPAGSTVQPYGGQVFAGDLVGIAVGIGLLTVYPDTMRRFVLGTAVLWGVSGPAIHLAHRQPRRALTSLGLRLGLSVGLGGLLYLVVDEPPCPCEGDQPRDLDHPPTSALLAYLAGGLTAQAIDWLVLSRRQVPAEPEATSVLVMPVRGGGIGLGFGGRF